MRPGCWRPFSGDAGGGESDVGRSKFILDSGPGKVVREPSLSPRRLDPWKTLDLASDPGKTLTW